MRKYKVLFLDDVFEGNFVSMVYIEAENYKIVDQITFAYAKEKNLYRDIIDVTEGEK